MKITNTLLKTFLFRGLDENTFNELITLHPPALSSFKRGELVFSSDNQEKKVGFVHSGRCEIQIRRDDGTKTVLNVLSEGDSFGILSLYAEDFPTQIFATKNCEIVYFSEEQIQYFVNNNSQISTNLIKFLADRIIFLNKKIATFSGNRVEDRLVAFILSESQRLSSLSFPFNRQKTAENINAGRASVYRALASLEESGLITLVDKKIIIKDLSGLERIVK